MWNLWWKIGTGTEFAPDDIIPPQLSILIYDLGMNIRLVGGRS
jgi:hypothetical protein